MGFQKVGLLSAPFLTAKRLYKVWSSFENFKYIGSSLYWQSIYWGHFLKCSTLLSPWSLGSLVRVTWSHLHRALGLPSRMIEIIM